MAGLDGWTDPDRRDDALLRCLVDVHSAEVLSPVQARIVGAMSHGLAESEVADVLGVSFDSVHSQMKAARRRLRAKNAAHAVAISLRLGIIS